MVCGRSMLSSEDPEIDEARSQPHFLEANIFIIVLVHLGCRNRGPQTGGFLSSRHSFFSQFSRLIIQEEVLSLRLANGCLLAVYSDGLYSILEHFWCLFLN